MERREPRPAGRRALISVVAMIACATLVLTTAGALGDAAGAAPAGPAAMCPADAGNARFVRWTYFQILGRCPDSGGLAFWTGMLDNGLPRDQFTDMVDMSDENLVNNNVVGIYEGILGREPTAQELSFWVARIRTIKADDELIATLAASDEFFSSDQISPDGSTADQQNQSWITFAYNGILDRNPDEQGAAFFLALLGSPSTQASRFNVAFNYLERSDENTRDWVLAVYGAALVRAPDPAGGDFWVHWLASTHQTFRMWTYFLASPESYDIAQTQPNPPVFARTSASTARAGITQG